MLSSVDFSGCVPVLIAAFSAGRPNASHPNGCSTLKPRMPLHPRHDVADDVVADVPDVRVARRIREHLEAVELRPRRIVGRPRTRARPSTAAAISCRAAGACTRSWARDAIVPQCRGGRSAVTRRSRRRVTRSSTARAAACAIALADCAPRVERLPLSRPLATRLPIGAGQHVHDGVERRAERAQVVAAFGDERPCAVAALVRHRAQLRRHRRERRRWSAACRRADRARARRSRPTRAGDPA